jgi:hypothetical protein
MRPEDLEASGDGRLTSRGIAAHMLYHWYEHGHAAAWARADNGRSLPVVSHAAQFMDAHSARVKHCRALRTV